MRTRLLPPLLPPVLIPLLFAAAWSGPPVSSRSYVAPCLIACPAGDSTFVVVTRDAVGDPWLAGDVVIEFCGCPGFHLAASQERAYLVDRDGCTISRQPDGLGVSRFPVAGGGTCGAGAAHIFVGGVDFGTRAVATPDQNGDWIVSADDIEILAAKLGASDPSGDFDCDGVVSEIDVAIAESHLGHRGDLLTAVAAASWGRVKIIYR